MGVNLVPIVRSFSIHTENFPGDSHDIADGCVTAGLHRVMRFDFLTHNKGDTDLVVGNPADHPEWFVLSASHGHYHLIDFNQFQLYDADGNPTAKGAKQAFCLEDIEKKDPNAGPAQFLDCNTNQGVTAGWADLYDKSLPCQYIVIDGLPDGDYTMLSTTNAKKLFPEDTFDDNTICTGLRIAGDNVSEIDPPIGRQLITNTVNFNDVPEGETVVRAVRVDIKACRSVTIRFQGDPTVNPGSAAGTVFATHGDTTASLPETNKIAPRELRLWLSYKGTNEGDVGSGAVTVSCDETGDTWVVPITANTIQRPNVGVIMVLDQSGSMLYNSGLASVGLPLRNDVLKFAAPQFVEVMEEDNGIGIVAFDQDSYDRMGVEKIGPTGPVDLARTHAKQKIAAHAPNPNGTTSIGDGVERASNNFQSVTDYNYNAIVVLTDGEENTEKFIKDLSPGVINDRVYAIGLGTVEEINPVALTKLTKDSGGYLLLTGTMGPDNVFLLSKYYLQILAGVLNKDIVLDPEGYLAPGQKHSISFTLNEADITSDIILLSDAPPATFKFALKTPTGQIIDPGIAGGLAMVRFIQGANVSYYRITLPAVIQGKESGPGTWHVLLTLDKAYYKRYLSSLDRNPAVSQSVMTHGVRYSVSVHSLSCLRMDARVLQSSNEPGATMTIRAVLTEYGLPVDYRANVSVEIERPDHTQVILALSEIEPGVFEAQTAAPFSGIYSMRARANGATMRSKPFTREQLLTGAVWKGGDNPPPTAGTDSRARDEQLCRLLGCLFGSGMFNRLLAEYKVNPKALQECLRRFCKERTERASESPKSPDAPPPRLVSQRSLKTTARSASRKSKKSK